MNIMKPLFIPLKKEYFLAFENHIKTTEYRQYGPRWNERTVYFGRPATLCLGYNGRQLDAIVLGMRKIKNRITDIYPRGSILCAIDIVLT